MTEQEKLKVAVALAGDGDDAVELARYVDNRKEAHDFRNQLLSNCVDALPGFEDEWDDRMGIWCETIEEDDEENELVEWFALHGRNHIYCHARRILTR